MKYSLQKRISAFVLAFALVMTTAFNSIGATTKADAAAKVKTLYLTKKTTSLVEGETGTAQWAVKATKATKALAAVKVTTSDSSVVKITKTTQSKKAGKTAKAAKKNKGTVKFTAVSAGTATITIVTKKKTKKTKSFKVTVTAKSTEAPATTATTQASADAATTTQAPATTEAPSSADASGVALKAVKLSNKTPKVGDTITAVLDPVNAFDVSTYTWYEDAKEVSGNATNTYTVSSDAVGKVIKVIVTTKDGTKFESDTSAAVIVDNSTKVEITDESGFQANGTVLLGDLLGLTFGDGLGVPEQVTWYVNNKLISTSNSKNGSLRAFTATTGAVGSGSDIETTGQCYAIVKNEEGKTFKSNVVEIVEIPAKAKMSNISISEDYSSAANIAVDQDVASYVISVTLNKNYAGTFYVIPESAEEVKTGTGFAVAHCNVSTPTANAPLATNVTGTIPNTALSGDYDISVIKSADDMTVAKAAGLTSNKVRKRVLPTGGVQYMFSSATSALKRGTKYKIVFDQVGIDSDDITTNNNKSANVSDAVLAPYIKAPTRIDVTDVQVRTTDRGWTATLYNGNDKCTWLTYSTVVDKNSKVNLFEDTDNDTKDGTPFGVADVDTFDGGVAKLAAGAKAAGGTGTFVYATFTGDAGLFGKDKLTLTSSATSTAREVVSSVSLAEGTGDKAADVDVKFTNLAADSDVYLIKASKTSATLTDNKLRLENAIEKFKSNDSGTYAKVASANAGSASITIKNAMSEITDTAKGDVYAVVIIPKTTGFATFKGSATFKAGNNELNTTNGVNIFNQIATTYVMSAKTFENAAQNTTDLLVLNDQFGKSMKGYIPAKSKNMTPNDGNSTTTNQTVSLDITADGELTVTMTEGAADAVVGDQWSLTLKDSQKIYATVKSVTAGSSKKVAATWTVEVK